MTEIIFPARDYDLAATLDSGQVFRWRQKENSWVGIVGQNWVRLTKNNGAILAETARPQANWHWLKEFLQTDIHLDKILRTFPDDDPMNNAIAACHGLRVLRQEPWECLASFILSSTKQIVQIRQIVANLCESFGEPVAPPPVSNRPVYSFPRPEKIAALSETQLRDCKMGFRAPNLLAAARRIAEGKFDLEHIRRMDY